MSNDDLLDAMVKSSENAASTESKTVQAYAEGEEIPYDPVDFETVRFVLPTISVQPLTIPSEIRLVEPGIVEWSRGFFSLDVAISDSVPKKGKKPKQGLLKDFAALEEASDAEICAFIGTWGFLGIETTMEAVACLHCPSHTLHYFREQTATYRHWARRVRALQNIAREVQQENSGSMEDWAIWLERQEEERALAKLRRTVGRILEVLPDKDPQDHPLIEEATQKLDFARDQDRWAWDFFQSIDGLDVSASKLTDIVEDWIGVETWFSFADKGSLGQARPHTRLRLADRMRQRFWMICLYCPPFWCRSVRLFCIAFKPRLSCARIAAGRFPLLKRG